MNAIYLMFLHIKSSNQNNYSKEKKKSPFNDNLNNTKRSQGSDIRNTITLRKKKKTTLIQINNYTNQ